MLARKASSACVGSYLTFFFQGAVMVFPLPTSGRV